MSTIVRVLLLFVIILLPGSVDAKTLEFKGKEINHKKSGLVITGHKDQNAVVVASLVYHFRLALPYSETWEFESNRESPLYGLDDRYQVTLSLGKAKGKEPVEQLDDLLVNLRKPHVVEIKDAEIISSTKLPVLRYRTRLAAPPPEVEEINFWRWNYWTIAVEEDTSYTVHLSIADAADEVTEDEHARLLMFFGQTLRTNYDRQ